MPISSPSLDSESIMVIRLSSFFNFVSLGFLLYILMQD